MSSWMFLGAQNTSCNQSGHFPVLFVSSIHSTPLIFVMSISHPLLFLSSIQIVWFGLNTFKVQAVAQQLFHDE